MNTTNPAQQKDSFILSNLALHDSTMLLEGILGECKINKHALDTACLINNRMTTLNGQMPLVPYSTSLEFNPCNSQLSYTTLSKKALHEVWNAGGIKTQRQAPENDFERAPYANLLLEFLNPFFTTLLAKKPPTCAQDAFNSLISSLQIHCEREKELKTRLLKEMNIKRFLVPYVDIHLPAEAILHYNDIDEDDPRVLWYLNHPTYGKDVRKLGAFLDKYDANNQILCMFIWSSVDNKLVNLPCVGLNPYPLCWHCNKKFGMLTCSRCGIAKYCSKECHRCQWTNHKSLCTEWAQLGKEFKHVYIS